MPNRLARELSPYLRQHAHNPVDWHPWGDEAFALARETQRPIFLSVGYATCHWCHVMEHESFEDARVADILNRDFVPVKVDREERPDIDRVYMTFVQATTGGGGWPMSVWLTPDLQPFYGGTYFPPSGQWGRPGFSDVLKEIARAWREDRASVMRSASEIVERLRAIADVQSSDGDVPGAEALDRTRQQFERMFDRRWGGFGEQPKFPRPSELLFLLREAVRTGQPEPRDMVVKTLRAMALGGMRDHIGGGFHRYSVDGQWRVPHFEKMLYDQAQLVLAYVEAAQLTGDAYLLQVAEDTCQYVARDMHAPEGGFFSAEDADSVPSSAGGESAEGQKADPTTCGARAHKVEGAFYVFSTDEVRRVLGDAAPTFERRYGLRPEGNALADPHGEFTGLNILYTAASITDIAQATGQTPAEVGARLLEARQRLFGARASRLRPECDDKILTAWNGLMIGAAARAGRVMASLDTDDAGFDVRTAAARHVQMATDAAACLEAHVWRPDTGQLLRRYRHGEAGIDAFAEDYACLIFGLLELLQATGDARWLRWAIDLQRRQDARFLDEARGGYFSTTGDDPSVLVRTREQYDGAEPSATSVAAINLLTLAALTGDAGWTVRASAALGSMRDRLERDGRAVPLMAVALQLWLHPPTQVVVVGPPERDDTRALWAGVHRAYRPWNVALPVTPGDAQHALSAVMPWLGAMTMIKGRATAYVCRHFACEAPVTEADALAEALD
ncbi:MAG: thioredoxin domain-containing protein [Acidobacteria bacterium]|nr:thioredoxin domain-containing protein [Acidobacteriota bacterium]